MQNNYQPIIDMMNQIDFNQIGKDDYIDLNGNGFYDPPVRYPTGLVMIQDASFMGQLGIPNPEDNGGNSWGTGRICNFYLDY